MLWWINLVVLLLIAWEILALVSAADESGGEVMLLWCWLFIYHMWIR